MNMYVVWKTLKGTVLVLTNMKLSKEQKVEGHEWVSICYIWGGGSSEYLPPGKRMSSFPLVM